MPACAVSGRCRLFAPARDRLLPYYFSLRAGSRVGTRWPTTRFPDILHFLGVFASLRENLPFSDGVVDQFRFPFSHPREIAFDILPFYFSLSLGNRVGTRWPTTRFPGILPFLCVLASLREELPFSGDVVDRLRLCARARGALCS